MHVNFDRFPPALTLPAEELGVVTARRRCQSQPGVALRATQRALDSAPVAVRALEKRTALAPATRHAARVGP